MLSEQHADQKIKNRHALYQIVSSIKFLCRQGLALRGHQDDTDGNMKQLLQMKAEDDAILAEWLKRKENVYTSPDIQNEILKVMGLQILRTISKEIHSSPFLTIMADETTDTSNKEQVTLVVRRVAEDLEVYEEFLGLYSVESIDAATISTVIKDLFIRMNLSLEKLRGQCYDGASAMSGTRSGVAKRIADLESRAVYTHCYGHALNLAASDTLKQCKLMKDALDTSYEITKLIKYSPRRERIFQSLRENLPAGSTPGIRVLCPTRWTVRADSLLSITRNYDTLQNTWEEAIAVVKDSESKARIHGVSAQMKKFDYLYGNTLGELVLRHNDNLSRTLQNKSLSAAEGQQAAKMTVQTIQSIRSDEAFNLFWEKVNRYATDMDVSGPQLPRQRKLPRRYDDGSSRGDFHHTPKEHYRQYYFEAIDLIINCIKDRFDQPGYRIYSSLVTLLLKACKKEPLEDDLETVCTFYKDDFDRELLSMQLQTFGVHIQQTQELQSSSLAITDVKKMFLSLSEGQKSLLSQVKRLLQLILVMPATNSTSERSFSALRRVKSYLRATMTQERLNYLMLIHVHKERTDALDLKGVINEFIGDSAHRSGIFAKY